MKIPDFKFKQEGVTLDWMQEDSIVGYIRIHTDPDKIPGPVSYSCAIEVYKDNTFELKLLKKIDEAATESLREKLTPLVCYLHSLGLHGNWSRAEMLRIKDIKICKEKYSTKNENPKE